MTMDDRFVISDALKARLRAGENKAAAAAQVSNRAVEFVNPDVSASGDFQGGEVTAPSFWGPVTFSVVLAGTGAAAAAWEDPVDTGTHPITGYAVELHRDNDDVLIGAVVITVAEHEFTGLTLGVPVYFRVRVIDVTNAATWAVSDTVTPT